MESGGIEWSGIDHGFIVWFCKKWMEWNGVGWYPFHQIPPIKPILHSIQFGVYPMGWNTFLNNYNFTHIFTITSATLFFCLFTVSYFFFSFLSLVPFYYLLCYYSINIHTINKVLFLNSIHLVSYMFVSLQHRIR